MNHAQTRYQADAQFQVLSISEVRLGRHWIDAHEFEKVSSWCRAAPRCRLPTSFMLWQDKSVQFEEPASLSPETRSSAGNATEPPELPAPYRTPKSGFWRRQCDVDFNDAAPEPDPRSTL